MLHNSGQPVLNGLKETLGADLLEQSKVDVLQMWGETRRAMTESPLSQPPARDAKRLMCCKNSGHPVLNAFEGSSSLSDVLQASKVDMPANSGNPCSMPTRPLSRPVYNMHG